MKLLRSYVTNPEYLKAEFLDYNSDLAQKLSANVNFVIHNKEIFEPTISPIIGSGLPDLKIDESDKLRTALEEYAKERNHVDFKLSPDVFAEIFSNADSDPNLLLHTFSGRDADFVIHNVYSDRALDAAFDHLSPALFIPEKMVFSKPEEIYILLFSEQLGSDLSTFLKTAKIFNSKLNFIIQEPSKNGVTESVLEKITKINNIDLKDFRFSARFVDEINDDIIDELQDLEKSNHWTVFQHSFLIKEFNNKKLKVDMYELLSEAKHPMVIV